ncbi:MAG: hypothetical protein JO023_23765 [Chloroflexi bacterium]|nr:hypothetical protein [Chloroflexota bacterium]
MGELAETLGAGVVHDTAYVNIPGSHPLNLGPRLDELLPDADVILFLDPDIPYVPTVVRPAADARTIQIDREPLKEGYVVWNFPMDLRITGSVAAALPLLRQTVETLQTTVQRQRADQRRTAIAGARRRWMDEAVTRARSKGSVRPMDGEWVAWCLRQVLPDDAIVVDDAVTNRHWLQTHLQRDEPGTYLTSGGSSLGWAPGAAIGVKLARPDRTVVSILGDGGFVFANPVAALWTAEHAAAPSLTVVLNNGGYNASKQPIGRLYPEGAVVRADDGVVTSFDPAPDYARIAGACGAYGVAVTEPERLEPELRRALDEVRHGRSAVVDAVLRPI